MVLTEKSLQNAYIGEYVGEVYTFDFQNDGSLNWTAHNIGYGTPDYVTGQGRRLYRNDQDSEGRITPPSDMFDSGTLKNIKMRIYKGFVNHGSSSIAYGVGAGVVCGNNRFMWSPPGANVNYDRISYRANVSSTSYITTIDYAGEAVLELNLEGATPILTINGSNTYTLTGSITSAYQSYWTNKTLELTIGNRRGGSGDIYIRKVEFITV